MITDLIKKHNISGDVESWQWTQAEMEVPHDVYAGIVHKVPGRYQYLHVKMKDGTRYHFAKDTFTGDITLQTE